MAKHKFSIFSYPISAMTITAWVCKFGHRISGQHQNCALMCLSGLQGKLEYFFFAIVAFCYWVNPLLCHHIYKKCELYDILGHKNAWSMLMWIWMAIVVSIPFCLIYINILCFELFFILCASVCIMYILYIHVFYYIYRLLING